MAAENKVNIQVGGVTPFTTIDFPGKLAAVIFCQGCPWHCTYCHNRHLLPPDVAGQVPWDDVIAWLKTRRELLEGVVFSGGEPLLQRQLPEAIAQMHELGFVVAIHTSGVYPHRLENILPMVEWVGLDIKAPFDEYATITGGGDGERVRQSLRALLASKKPHELRCTLDPEFITPERAEKLAHQLMAEGAKELIIQAYRDPETHNKLPVSRAVIDAFERIMIGVGYRF